MTAVKFSEYPQNKPGTTSSQVTSFMEYDSLPQTAWTTTSSRHDPFRPWTAPTTRWTGYQDVRPKTAQDRGKEVHQRNRLEEFHRDHLPAIYGTDSRDFYSVRWRPAFSREQTTLSTMDARRISPETQQKIVSHLRRKLSRRMDTRLQQIMARKTSTAKSRTITEPAPTPKSRKISEQPPPPPTPPPDPKERYNEFGEPCETYVNGIDNRTHQNGVTSAKKGGEKRGRSVTLALPHEDSTDTLQRQDSLASLPELAVSTDEESDEGYGLDMSPVPTPLIYRPRTREESRLSRMTLEEKVEKIVRGAIHIKPPGDARIMRIYIGSAFTDTAEDRLHLQETMYQDAKQLCQLRQYELQLYDLHLGVSDWITDDHSAPDMALQLLDTCVEGSRSLSFVTFLSQKYGNAVLPTLIPQDEFDIISKTVTNEFTKQKVANMGRPASELEDVPEDGTQANGTGSPANYKSKLTRQRTSRNMQTIVKRRESKIKEAAEHRIVADVYDPALLRSWYALDENVVPPAYRLQRISTQIPDILRNDPSKRQQARNNWTLAQNRLVKMLQTAVSAAGEEIFDKKKYFCSVADLEIEYALLTADRPRDQVVWYQRQITDLHNNLNKSLAKDYADVMPLEAEVDPKAKEKLAATQRKLRNKIEDSNIRQFEVSWDKYGVTRQSRDHVKVMAQMGRDFKNIIATRLTKLINDEKNRNSIQTTVYDDVVPHVTFCQQQCESFHGRKDVLNTVKRYTRSKSRSPLIMHGQSGSGKSSIIARIAKDLKKWYTDTKGISCIVRIIGVTAETRNIRKLLRSLCRQLAVIQKKDVSKIPQDFRGLMNEFPHRLSQATAEMPIVILLDGLDQLTDDYNARQMDWLPKELPKHVKMIASTLPEGILPKLKTMFTEEDFVEVATMPESEAMIVVDHWLQQDRRTLTQFQYDKLIEAFKQCPLPLYLKLIYRDSMEWYSYTDQSRIKLQNSIKNSILGLFTRLEAKHGEPLVRRVLGYFTAARNGLTENEVEDLLSLDDVVMDDLDKMMKLQNRRCPSLAWARLKMDLKDYLVERNADGCSPLQWFHPQFREAATERYLNQKDRAPSYHKAIAEYFSGQWAAGKPIGASDKKVNRFIAEQPNYFPRKDNDKLLSKISDSEKVYNLRKMSELPYNLLKGGMFKDLKKTCLCNFTWLLHKTTAAGIAEVLNDFTIALQAEPEDTDLKLLSHALFLSYKVLQNDPNQLSTQLVGRLQDMLTADKPATPADPRKYPSLHPLLRQAKKSDLPSLIPSVTCLTPPDGTMFDLLSGHRKAITALTITTDGLNAITTSKDDTMKVWDLKSGRVVKTIQGVGRDVVMLRMALKNTMIVTSEKGRIRLWYRETGECSQVFEFVDPASITLANQGTVLAAYYDGSFVLRSWALTPEIKQLQEIGLEAYSSGYRQDESIAVSHDTSEALVLAAFRGANTGLVHNVVSGNLVHELKSANKGSSVIHVATSRDYFILGTRSMQSNVCELYQLELFEVTNGKYVRFIRGCQSDASKVLIINKMGSHALSVCGSDLNNTSTIAIWNLETEEHKHLAQHSAVSTMAVCTDLRFVLSGSRHESSLRIWNLMKGNQNVTKLVEKTGIKSLQMMNKHSQYAVAESFQRGTVLVTNLRRNKYRGKVVMKEINLVGSQDIILFRDHMATILTDRSSSSVTEDNQQVFQTLKRYNMKTGKFESQVKDCFIFPSPSHEFKILSDFRLMGLSENRSHFIIWNTENGHIKYRIKPNKKILMEEMDICEKGLALGTSKNERSQTSWDRRNDDSDAREDLKRELDNAIDQFIISKDETTIVASFYAHFICVFDIESQTHTGTLLDRNSMMLLHNSALTSDGRHLVLTNFNDQSKTSFVTLWDCKTSTIKKRLGNVMNVCAIAINDKADRIVLGKEGSGMRIWDPKREKSIRKLLPYKGMVFGNQSRIHLINDGQKAAVFAGDISLWDLEKGELISVFTSDMRIQSFEMGLGGELLVFGLRDTDRVIALRLSRKFRGKSKVGGDIFGEGALSSESEEEDEDDE